MPEQTYEEYYQRLLNDSSIPSILGFNDLEGHRNNQKDQNPHSQIFPLCQNDDIPQFFKNNLLSPNRIIKQVNGQYFIYRIFYYQLFKLMFELQNQTKNYLEIVKQIIFDPDILNSRNGQNSRAMRQSKKSQENSRVARKQNHKQQSASQVSESQQPAFRRQFQINQKCLAEFIQKVVQNKGGFSSFEPYLYIHPSVDESMIIFLQTFIQNYQESEQQEIDSVQLVLEYFCQIFEIQLVMIDNCFKFQESDVFLYIEQKQQGEICAFIAFDQLTDGSQDTVSQNSRNQQLELSKQQQNHTKKNQENSYRIDQNKLAQQNDIYGSNSKNQRQSSSYKDRVITSDINAQSNRKILAYNLQQFALSPSIEQENFRNVRITSQMTASRNLYDEKTVSDIENSLSKSNELPNSRKSISELPNSTATKFGYNGFNTQKFSIDNGPFTNMLGQNPAEKDRNFHKKTCFQQDLIIQDDISKNSMKKIESQTEAYNENNFKKHSNRRPSLEPIDNQSSFNVVQNGSDRNFGYENQSESRKIGQSKTETIINMFGDMLKSTANINSFDQSFTNMGGFGSGRKFGTEQPHHDNDHNYSQTPIKYQAIYSTSNNFQSKQASQHIDFNQVNMKKTKPQNKILLQTKSSNHMFDKVQIKTNFNQYEQANQKLKSEKNNRNKNANLMDSEQLRSNDYSSFNIYPQVNLQGTRDYDFKKEKYAAADIANYLQNIEAKSFNNEIQSTSRRKGSSSNSCNSSSKSSHNGSNQGSHVPNVNVNSVKSYSQNSQNQRMNRNNYYGQGFITSNNRMEQFQRNDQKSRPFSIKMQEKQFSIKSDDNPQKQTNHIIPSLHYNEKNIEHGYKSQQYVNIAYNDDCSRNLNVQSRAYTSNNENKQKNMNISQNSQEDDFFFRPGFKTSPKYGLKSIEQVRASKQTNRDSHRLDDASKISSNQNRLGSSKFQQYALVKSIEGGFQRSTQIQKPLSRLFNRVLSTQPYYKKQTSDQSTNNGTFYKQFTNSKILKLLREPHKTKVQILKNRFKGEHRTSINNAII